MTRSVHGLFGLDEPAGLGLLVLGLKRVLGSRVQLPKELSGFDDVSSSLYFIIGLSLWVDQTGVYTNPCGFKSQQSHFLPFILKVKQKT